jgi:hypothetical protein
MNRRDNSVPDYFLSAYHCIPLHPPLMYEVNGKMAGEVSKQLEVAEWISL